MDVPGIINGGVNSRIKHEVKSMSFVIIRQTKEMAWELRKLLLPQIARALDFTSGEATAEDLLFMALHDNAQVWTIQDKDSMALAGVVVTQVIVYPQMSVLRVVTLGGEGMDGWARELDDSLTAFCKKLGLKRMEAFGRKGLAKKLDKLAFLPKYTVYSKEVGA